MCSTGCAALLFITFCVYFSFTICISESESQQKCTEKAKSASEKNLCTSRANSKRPLNISPGIRVVLNEDSTIKKEEESRTTKRRLKILISNPSIGWSHSQFQGALADALVEAGHEVHLLAYSMNTEFGNYTGSAKAHRVIWHDRPKEKLNELMEMASMDDLFRGARHPFWTKAMRDFTYILADTCKELVANDELLEYLKNERYDFGISEVYDLCAFGIFKHVRVRTSAISQAVAISSTVTSFFGIPNFSSFVYDVWAVALSDPLKMNFFGRAVNFFYTIADYYTMRDLCYNVQQPVFDEAFGESAPRLREVMRNVSLAFINSKEFFSLPRPLSHKIIYVGGIAAKEKKSAKVLPEEFAPIMNKPSKGVVLFSFGTFADTRKMHPELRNAFVEAFAQFPEYTFIWKFNLRENDTMNVSPNVHVFEWIPQRAILEHPKLKVFISHCGLNSANEAAKVGVPVLALPLFGDQTYNAAIIINKGFGLAVDVRDVRSKGASVVVSALRQILGEPKFAEKARLVSRKLALTPFSPHEKFVKWVEFAAEFSELNELNMPTEAEMGVFVYYSLDVICAGVISSIALMSVAYWLLTFGIRLLAHNFSSNRNAKLAMDKKKI